MDVSISNADDRQTRLKVSVITRLAAALTYTIPMIGAALGSLSLINLFRELRMNESAGVGTVMLGMKEASLPVIVSLCVAAIFGVGLMIVLIVRMIVQTKTASPPFWFFAIGGILCLVPAALFFKAQLLIVQALSPGSSVGSAGLSGVGADISQLLLISIIAVPVLFIVLVVASVVPLSSGSGKKWGSLIVSGGVVIMLIATAIASPFLVGEPKRKKEIVDLPSQVKNADSDQDVDGETSMVLTLASDNKLYQQQSGDRTGKAEKTETLITKEELPAKIESFMENKTPDVRVVYFKCDTNAAYENVLQIFDAIRKADVDRVSLVVGGDKTADDPYQISPLSFDVRLPGVPDKNASVTPNPLTLVATLDKDGRLALNNERMGTVSDPHRLNDRLAEVFKERENNGVFREDSNEIEKTVFLKVSRSEKYGDFIKLVDAVKGAGAQPIGIQIDDVGPLMNL